MGCYQFTGTSECSRLVSSFDKSAPDFKMRPDKWSKNKSMRRFKTGGRRPERTRAESTGAPWPREASWATKAAAN